MCRCVRNLTDEQFRAICQLGGTAGLNLVGSFLSESGTATFEDFRRHLDHFLDLGGDDGQLLEASPYRFRIRFGLQVAFETLVVGDDVFRQVVLLRRVGMVEHRGHGRPVEPRESQLLLARSFLGIATVREEEPRAKLGCVGSVFEDHSLLFQIVGQSGDEQRDRCRALLPVDNVDRLCLRACELRVGRIEHRPNEVLALRLARMSAVAPKRRALLVAPGVDALVDGNDEVRVRCPEVIEEGALRRFHAISPKVSRPCCASRHVPVAHMLRRGLSDG